MCWRTGERDKTEEKKPKELRTAEMGPLDLPSGVGFSPTAGSREVTSRCWELRSYTGGIWDTEALI